MEVKVDRVVLDRLIRKDDSLGRHGREGIFPPVRVDKDWLRRLKEGSGEIKRHVHERSANREPAIPMASNDVRVPAEWVARLRWPIFIEELHEASQRHHREVLQHEGLVIAARDLEVEANLRKWTHFLQQIRPLREKYGSVCSGTEHRTTDVVMEEKQRSFFEAKTIISHLAREATALRKVPNEESATSVQHLRLELEEAIEDTDELLQRCARCGWG